MMTEDSDRGSSSPQRRVSDHLLIRHLISMMTMKIMRMTTPRMIMFSVYRLAEEENEEEVEVKHDLETWQHLKGSKNTIFTQQKILTSI